MYFPNPLQISRHQSRMSSSSTWASIAAKKPVAKVATPLPPAAQKLDEQKPIYPFVAHISNILDPFRNDNHDAQRQAYIPPRNRCGGCRMRLKLTNGDEDKPVGPDTFGIFDCLCDTCTKCGALYHFWSFEGKRDGGPCNCGNTEYTL